MKGFRWLCRAVCSCDACSCGLDGRWMISVSMMTIHDRRGSLSHSSFVFSSYQAQKSCTLSCFHTVLQLLSYQGYHSGIANPFEKKNKPYFSTALFPMAPKIG